MSDLDLVDVEISASATTFLSGLGKILGHSVHTDGERFAVAFEPWSIEQRVRST